MLYYYNTLFNTESELIFIIEDKIVSAQEVDVVFFLPFLFWIRTWPGYIRMCIRMYVFTQISVLQKYVTRSKTPIRAPFILENAQYHKTLSTITIILLYEIHVYKTRVSF